METVGNYPDLASAQLAQSVLAAEGIESTIPDQYMAGTYWGIQPAMQGVRLQVAPDDAEAARLALDSAFAPEDEPAALEIGDDDAIIVCPHCGSTRIRQSKTKHRVKAATMFSEALILIWPWLRHRLPTWRCDQCGREWADERQ